MPILEVEIVTDLGETLKSGLAQQLADAAGDALGTPRGRTWVRLRALPREQYAESRAPLANDIQPVFVSVLKSRSCGPLEVKDEAARLCDALALACGRPRENIHILYLPDAAGRMAFGGELVPVLP